MTVILHTYTNHRIAEQWATLVAMLKITRMFSKLGYEVNSRHCAHDSSYWYSLCMYWEHQTIINIEQDIVPTPEMVEQLMECDHAACAFYYRIPPDNHLSVFHRDGDKMIYENGPVPEFVEGSSIGLAKIDVGLQHLIPLWDYDYTKYKWWYLDTWLSEQMAEHGIQWHIHGEVIHNHG